MQPQDDTSSHPLVWVAAVTLIVSCAVGVATLMGWLPT
jgi:hypothetical protein